MGKRILSTLICIFAMTLFSNVIAKAEEKTTIITSLDSGQVNIGQEFRVYVKAQNVYDLYGVQFTINYNTELLDLVSNSLEMKNGFKSFGGETVDKTKGIVTYPLINSGSKKELMPEQIIGELVFRGKSKGSEIFKMSNIKAVNSDAVVISNNTNYSVPVNVVSTEIIAVDPVPGTNNPGNEPGGGANPGSGNNSSDDENSQPSNEDEDDNEDIASNDGESESDSENDSDEVNKEEDGKVVALNEGATKTSGQATDKDKVEEGSTVNKTGNSVVMIFAGLFLIFVGVAYRTGLIEKLKGRIKKK